MLFLEILREERSNPTAVYHQFVLKYPGTKNDIHAFLEGRDDPSFYLNFLRQMVSDIQRIHIYRCNNKKGVFDAYSKVMQIVTNQSSVLFFVDRDHSDFVGESHLDAPNIYITDFYSIENYIVTEEMFRRVWEEFFNTVNLNVHFDTILEKFRGELQRFYRFVLPLSAWIVINRRCGNKLNLNNVKLADLYTFSNDLTLQSVELSDLLKYVERVCSVDPVADLDTSLPDVVKELTSFEPKQYVRGKFELWFFIRFIDKLVGTLRDLAKSANQNFKMRTQFGEESAIEILGPRVQMPHSLQEFFTKNGLVRVT